MNDSDIKIRSYKKITDYKEMIKLLDKVENKLADAAHRLQDHTFWEVVEDIYEIKMQFRKCLADESFFDFDTFFN